MKSEIMTLYNLALIIKEELKVKQADEIHTRLVYTYRVSYFFITEIYRCVRMKLELNRANQNEATINHYK